MKTRPSSTRCAGFTLLELVLAMILLAIIVGMVFGIARTSLALGNTIVATQNEEMEHQAFMDLLSQRFSALPGNTRLELKSQDSGGRYLSDLTLQNVPLSFTWGGQERIAKAVQLSTVKRRSGYLDIVLRYYENEILEGAQSTFGKSALDKEPFAEIVLLSDVAYFEWRALDGQSLEWQYDWEILGRLPIQLELVMAIGAKGEEMRQIFWLPPKQNPEVMMRQLQQGGSSGANGAPGGGGAPGAGSGIPIPAPGGSLGGQTGTPQIPGGGGGR